MPPSHRDHFIAAPDGLKLHVRDDGPREAGRLPVICLAGLTRTVEDFDALTPVLAHDAGAPRRVVAIDSRGRGLSERDPEPANYTIAVEAADVLAVAATLGIGRAIIVGTSRGGLIALTLAAMMPALLAGVVFNDVGPVLGMAGLLRIKGYAGRITRPTSWAEAARAHKALFGRDFPNVTDEGWMRWARRSWREVDGRFKGTCDPHVADGFAAIDPANPPPPLWPLYDALPDIPLMVIRGALSDLLDPETVAGMAARRPRLEVWEVPGEGHAPLLEDAPTISRIAAFVRRCDGKAPVA
ncbi:MAG: alpha/beta hydrolase [Xanthobacteraceae bacterium]|nr:MAG: alpha/beta hydrolase [Xanthobacteraceae bacterium]